MIMLLLLWLNKLSLLMPIAFEHFNVVSSIHNLGAVVAWVLTDMEVPCFVNYTFPTWV